MNERNRERESHARKVSTKINLFVGPEAAQWGGLVRRKGVGSKGLLPPSLEGLFPRFETQGKQALSLGCPWNSAWTSRTTDIV